MTHPSRPSAPEPTHGFRSAPIPRAALGLLGAVVLTALAPPATAQSDHLFALTTDYSTGSSSTMGLVSPWGVQHDVEAVGADPVARPYQGLIYVVNRQGDDNLQIVDPSSYETIRQISLGPGSNPQDISLVSPTRAYVPRYNADTVLEIDPTTGAILDEISLAPFADSDGFPEASRSHYQAPFLYIQVQRLDRSQFYEPVGDSYLAVIDTRDNVLVDVDAATPGIQGILLAATNPNGPMELDLRSGRHLLVPCSGSFADPSDGGLERVDLQTWRSDGLVVAGADLGGDLLHFTQHDGQTGFAIVSDPGFVTCLVPIGLDDGSVGSPLHCSSGFDLADCVVSAEGSLYLADRTFSAPGIRVFDAATGLPLASGVVSVGLPPVELHLIRPGTSSLPGLPVTFSRPIQPNPSRDAISWELTPESGQVGVEVVDVLGRRIRSLPPDATEWNGIDDFGRRVPSGTYWLRIVGHGDQATARFVRIQ